MAPTATNAKEVIGVNPSIGIKIENAGKINNVNANNNPVKVADKPVLAPLSTPIVLSAKLVTVEVPKIPQIKAPPASASMAFLPSFNSPFSSNIPASFPTASKVAVVSNKLTKMRANITA